MEEYWATRTGRWRKAMKGLTAPSLADRLYEVIRKDVQEGQLPHGAILPTSERVASELVLKPDDVQAAYARLLSEGLIEERDKGRLCIVGHDRNASIGDATQIRFEAALLKAVREAAARGLSSTEATGMFKAAAIRLDEMQGKKEED
jgi:DNA-binding transcriptional regulator YhcF (GntR family)